MKHTNLLLMFAMAAVRLHAAGLTVGVLPFADATASGGATLGEAMSRATQAEFIHSTNLEGRVIPLPGGMRPDQLDSQKAVGLGRDTHVDLVLLGTVLSAQAEDSSKSGSGPSVFGQSVGLGLHSTKATVTLQADLYDVASGKKLASLRLSGVQTDRKAGGNLYTSLGSVDTTSSTFQKSTLGKAMQKAIADMVRQVAGESAKMTRLANGKEAK